MSASHDFVGQGWALPVRAGSRTTWRPGLLRHGTQLADNPRGGIALVAGPEKIVASLRMILGTAPGERVMRPEFGCAVWDQLFAPNDPNTRGLITQAVREAIGMWEPRVELEEVLAEPDPTDAAKIVIDIRYRIKATNDRRNLVHPFYVIPGEAAT